MSDVDVDVEADGPLPAPVSLMTAALMAGAADDGAPRANQERLVLARAGGRLVSFKRTLS